MEKGGRKCEARGGCGFVTEQRKAGSRREKCFKDGN